MRPAFRTRFAHSRAHSTDETRRSCLSLMRTTAQSVSVITTVLPSSSGESTEQAIQYHGATLSSFTSVSMYPHPIVSFSLRTPSRMADSLRGRLADIGAPRLPHMVINLLSASQPHLAIQFSRPRTEQNIFTSIPYFLSPEGIPILRNSLGALSCSLVRSIPLDDTDPVLSQTMDEGRLLEGDFREQGSELFVARVLRVESGTSAETKATEQRALEQSALPLVYYRQQYVTVDHGQRLWPSTLDNKTES